MSLRRAAVVALLAFPASGAIADAPPPEPAGYRTADYRAPVPATVNGNPALTTEQAAALWRQRTALFIDTLPQPPRPRELPDGTIWHPMPRNDIPGSIWLPDTGYGELPAPMAEYFGRNLREATAGDKNRTLVFYCLANCWMSWNAAKRAASLGYARADWYAEGTDGWARQDLPLEHRNPVPRPVE
nr:PQQ-dependent catabolism-associated CXXCW motif protein [uncultured Rhodopila sp.]